MICPTIVLQPVRRNRSTAQSGTGLDGPQSSESDRLSKVLRDGLSDLRESSRSADASSDSQRLRSDTSGSIDWEKSWDKRRPRRKHDVSEISKSDFVLGPRAADLSSRADDNTDSNSGSDSEDLSDGKSCSYLSLHDAQLHAIQKYAANSCPELHRQLDEFNRSLSRLKVQDSQKQVSQLRSSLEKDDRRHYYNVRSIVTKRFRSLGRRIRRSGSSNFSIRSAFPAPPESKERRLLARDSEDIWPSSGEETPLFNTPQSDVTNTGLDHPSGHYFDPLAMASMIIATAELDRLSSRASLDRASRTSGSSAGFSGSSPISHTPIYSNLATPNNEASISDSTGLDMPPTMPYNTPASSGPQSGNLSPVFRSPQRPGKRRRTQRSRLSEVTTPDEVGTPAEPAEDSVDTSLSLSHSQIEPLQECSATMSSGIEDSVYPKPLAINRNDQEDTQTPTDGPSVAARENHPTTAFANCCPVLDVPSKSRTPQPPTGLSSDHGEPVSPPARGSSIGKIPESMYGSRVVENVEEHPLPSISFRLEHATESSVKSSDDATSTDSKVDQGLGSLASTKNDTVALRPDTSNAAPESCHPDTWSEAQGEPGNSDPFCPPDCLETRHSGQDRDIHLRPPRPVRQGTEETVRVPGARGTKEKDSDMDNGSQAARQHSGETVD
ncbi:hypothetical protein GGR54DRAFT_203132 [Hypoxylon sp. NC1633]|nr:hypothetical protein GGR54DRAFT_203132 [Hypoxylon sp. NC1633]